MKTTKLLIAVITFGLFAFPSMSEEYLSTDIVKGYSWKYLRVEHTGYELVQSIRIIDITIDSVWGNPSDTLFFWISERDSVNNTYRTYGDIYGDTTDTVYTQINHILCRKANRVTQCDNTTISELFSDHENTKYDTTKNEVLNISINSFCYPTKISFSQEQYEGLQLGYYRGGPNHDGTYGDTSVFCDHIGLLQKKYVYISKHPLSSKDISFTLLSRNGKDISYTCGVKPVYTRKSGNSMTPVTYRISFDRNNLIPGFNLLGRHSKLPVNTYGMRISGLSLQK
jgi:hypothetical protein